MRGGATEVNETQKWATSKKRFRTTALKNTKEYNILEPGFLCPQVRGFSFRNILFFSVI
jgi:hypothetical protein